MAYHVRAIAEVNISNRFFIYIYIHGPSLSPSSIFRVETRTYQQVIIRNMDPTSWERYQDPPPDPEPEENHPPQQWWDPITGQLRDYEWRAAEAQGPPADPNAEDAYGCTALELAGSLYVIGGEINVTKAPDMLPDAL